MAIYRVNKKGFWPAGDTKSLSLKRALPELRRRTEIEFITAALRITDWNKTKAARLLGISYRGLLYKIKEYGIKKPKKEEDL